jgi:predicted membrane chloride channel (bestrophin family)
MHELISLADRKQGVVLYIFFLPFSLVESLGLLVIPIVALVSFTLYGILAIGNEIENPCK